MKFEFYFVLGSKLALNFVKMPNRTKAPPIHEIQNFGLPAPNKYRLDNGMALYEVRMGTQDALKLEIIFDAGRPQEYKKLAARTTAALLKEGTQSFNAATIAETIDFYGGSLNVPVNLDTSNIILYSLTKHFEHLLPLIVEMMTVPVFPEKELKAFQHRNQQRLLVDLTKNDVIAYRTLTELIFGKLHPYGYNSFPETYAAVKKEDLLQHFNNNYLIDNCLAIISGKTHPKIIDLINHHIGSISKNKTFEKKYWDRPNLTPKKLKLEYPQMLQTAIRVGRKLFNRKHHDFYGFYVLNTILGGYFGSRLMTNIREEKGYTYNIYSTMDAMIMDGYFYIGTEVGNEVVQPTLKEIYKEMDRLQTDLVKEEELQMVRNYLLGNLLTTLDGAFNISEVIKTKVVEGLSDDYLIQLVNTIKSITAKDIQRLARKYLNKEDMWEVIVGV